MNEKMINRLRNTNIVLILIIIFLVFFGFATYKKYFDEKRLCEIGQTIHNVFSSDKTSIEEAEENLSVMDKMSFSQNGDVLFISIYYIYEEDFKIENLINAIEENKCKNWFCWNYVVVDIFHYKYGMVYSIEMNLETMETVEYNW